MPLHSSQSLELNSQAVDLSAPTLGRRLVAEGLGTGFLLISIVGSGILGERLAGGNTAIALLANALATGAALFALIEWFSPLSGAHFNPLVTLTLALRGDITGRAATAYLPAQVVGAIIGVGVANAMFGEATFSMSARVAAYIGGAFWFTATDFANPAVTIARALTDTFAGIRPSDVPGFIIAETIGAIVAVTVFRWLVPATR
jgi:glycerol uptake facilitator-like aquaporin